MRNLLIILGILILIAALAIYQLIPEIKKINFGQIFEQVNNSNVNENENLNYDEETATDEEVDENINEDEEEVEDVGELESYTLELGRSDADILSKKTYTFYLPKDIEYEVFGVDAPSCYIDFKKDGQVVFRLNNYDYVRDEDLIDEQYPDWEDYSFVGDHTNVLELLDDGYEDEMYIFADTLKIDGELAF